MRIYLTPNGISRRKVEDWVACYQKKPRFNKYASPEMLRGCLANVKNSIPQYIFNELESRLSNL